MKKIVMLLAVFLVPIIFWLLGAFIGTEINPMLWDEASRLFLVVLSLFITIITELYILENL